jgi:hypothetical protein
MNKFILLLSIAVVFSSCGTKTNDFVIKNKQVGKLSDSTTIASMKKLYENDSIVKNTEGQSAFEAYDEYTIYDKKTKKPLMTVVPVKINDEQSKIKRIEIKSDLFKIEKGVGLTSNFGMFSKNHKLNKIEETFKYIVVFIDDLDATIDMTKDVLPLNSRNDSSIKIDKTMIPDNSKIKHFVMFFND